MGGIAILWFSSGRSIMAGRRRGCSAKILNHQRDKESKKERKGYIEKKGEKNKAFNITNPTRKSKKKKG